MLLKKVIFGERLIFLLTLCTIVSTKPFLFNATRALATLASSASAYASSPALPYTNIADLRKRHEKAERLRAEKRLVENNGDLLDPEEADKNEVSPSLLQKKINKVLTKLQLISNLSEAYREESLEDFEKAFEDDADFEETESTSDVPQTSQNVAPSPRKERLESNFFGWFTENETTKTPETLVATNITDSNKLGQVGVFFAELFGSLVGLAYGAAAHFNNVTRGATDPVL